MIYCLVEKIKEISTITNRDYIEIVSTFMTLTEPRYRCDDCHKKYKNDPVKDKKLKESMACNYIASKNRHQYKPSYDSTMGNPKILYKKCVGNYYFGEWVSIINYYPNYEKGVMPFSGGLFDQPSKFVECMSLVHNLIRENEHEKKRQAELIQRNKSSGRTGKR